MEETKADSKLLAQDDIDSLLGEAGIEGDYEEEPKEREVSVSPIKTSPIRFANNTVLNIKATMEVLYSKAVLERDDGVKVIWNAAGTIPMHTGVNMQIHDTSYISMGTLHENHLMVKNNV